jgi:hypothetical protein
MLSCSQLFKLLAQWAEEHGPFYQITLKRRSLVVSDLRAIQVRPTHVFRTALWSCPWTELYGDCVLFNLQHPCDHAP